MKDKSANRSSPIADIKLYLHGLLHRFGVDIIRYPLPDRQFVNRKAIRAPFLMDRRINVVLDVGANIGQYASEMRQYGYRGRIISFEPMADEFKRLVDATKDDPQRECFQLALGNSDGPQLFNVAGNSYSSSLLPMCSAHREAAPQSAYKATQEVSVARLDTIAQKILAPSDRIWLKLDVQGYELEVLHGATQTLSQVQVVECELSLVPLYEGQALFSQMVEYFESHGFTLVSLESGFSDPRTCRLLQLESIFVRSSSLQADS